MNMEAKKINRGIRYKISVLIFTLIGITTAYTTSFIYSGVIANRTIESYVEARYNMDYTNIDRKIDIQKSILDETLNNTDFWYNNFKSDADLFKKRKICSRLLNADIYFRKRDFVDQKVKVKIYYNLKSDLYAELDQYSYLNLEIHLKCIKWNRYVIEYIRELDYQMGTKEIPALGQEHEHEHEYTNEPDIDVNDIDKASHDHNAGYPAE